jgi:hypothetical protein
MTKISALVICVFLFPVLTRAAETREFKNSLTAATGFPHFFTGQYSRQVGKKTAVGLAIGQSFVPETTKACGAKVSMSGANIEAVSRYHFKGKSFFGGFNAGYQNFSIESKQRSIPGSDYDIKDGVKVFYVTPHVGWFKRAGSGFTIGAELGIRVPLSTKRYTERSGPGDYTPEVRKAVDDGMELLAKKPLPFLTLLRLGYSF